MGDDFTSLDGHVTLVDRIAALHVVYRANSEYIHWFGQLTSRSPGILSGLVQSVQQTVGQDECIVSERINYLDRCRAAFPPLLDASLVCSRESAKWTEASYREQEEVTIR